ncbi:MAG: MFS transporter [Treponema sp.]|nr:MFS transporter [Treponema sp.]
MITFLLLIVIYLSFISLGLPDSLLGSAWPAMYESLNVPLHFAGIISMIVAGGTVISSVFSERVIRRFGTGAVTLFSVFLTAAALIGISFSGSVVFIILCAVPLGLGAGSVDAALNNYVALHFKARHMSWLHCFWGIGASIGPLIMSFYLTNSNSWNSGYRTISIIQFSLVFILFLSLPLWKKNKTERDPVLEENRAQLKNSPSFKEIFSVIGVKPALFAFFCYCALETVAGLWGASYLVMEKNMTPETAARWIALFYIGITAGRFISGFITMALNNRQMIRLGHIIIGCGIITLILPFENSSLPGLFLIGLGCAPIYPSMLHETPQNFGREYSQAIMGIQMGSAYIGTTIMPPIFGWLTSFTSFKIFPVFIGLILAVKIIMIEIVNKKIAKNKKTEEN